MARSRAFNGMKATNEMIAFVAVVVATYRRAPELKRLLESLAAVEPDPGTRAELTVIVVDNADDPGTQAAVEASRVDAVRLVPGANLGCGGGLAYGEAAALARFGKKLTHLWLLDDDTEVAPDALRRLLAAMEAEKAALACPMIVDRQGAVGWFPGLLDRDAFDAVRIPGTPAGFEDRIRARNRSGPRRPFRFSWATGVSLLVTRDALEQAGLHRDDFWIRGEDLDFSLRITARWPGIFVPEAVVAHLPRPAGESLEALRSERHKHRAMLQNVSYIAFRLPHGGPILKTVPGNFWRFARTWGIAALPEALDAFWEGAVLGRPAGAEKLGNLPGSRAA